jgi:hypothetical protein
VSRELNILIYRSMSRDSTVSIVTGLRAVYPRNVGSIPCRGKIFICNTKRSDPLWIHVASYSMGTRELFYGGKRPGHEADHLRPSGAEFENECSCASTLSYSFVTITGTTSVYHYCLLESFSAGAHRSVNVKCY